MGKGQTRPRKSAINHRRAPIPACRSMESMRENGKFFRVGKIGYDERVGEMSLFVGQMDDWVSVGMGDEFGLNIYKEFR